MNNCAICKVTIPNWKVIEGKNRNLQNRKYCLTCSPFGKHNTMKLEEKVDGFKTCPKCKENKLVEDFYNRRGKLGTSGYCKTCSNQQSIERQRKFKIDCVEYKGGCCSLCGYKKYVGALEFHHEDPSKKDFTIANQRKTTFDDRIKKELDKCVLVCANCHREIHGKI